MSYVSCLSQAPVAKGTGNRLARFCLAVLLLLVAFSVVPAHAQEFTYLRTLGRGVLDGPYRVSLNASGEIYVSEPGTNRIKVLNADGSLQKVLDQAAVSLPPSNNYSAFYPFDVAFDSNGTIYVADYANHRVQVLNSEGRHVRTIGGTGPGLFGAGNGNDQFLGPIDVAVDGAGNLYVCDEGNHRVQMYNRAGTYIRTIGTTGQNGRENNQFLAPNSVTTDIFGNVYVSDRGNYRIQVFDNQGNYVRTVGGFGTPDEFGTPTSVAVDTAGTLYVSDYAGSFNHHVRIFDVQGTRLATLGITDEPGPRNDQFEEPNGVAVDASGNLLVVDTGNNRIQVFAGRPQNTPAPVLTGVTPTRVPANSPETEIEVQGSNFLPTSQVRFGATDLPTTYSSNSRLFARIPASLLAEAGTFPISVTNPAPGGTSETVDFQVVAVDPKLTGYRYLKTIGGNGRGSCNYQFDGPRGVAVDACGNVFVADTFNHRIQVFNKKGHFVKTLGRTNRAGDSNNRFDTPKAVLVDASGKLYVADTANHRVQIFNKSGCYLQTIGATRRNGCGNDRLDRPRSLARDASGNLYVADPRNHRVQVYNEKGRYVKTFGTSGKSGTSNERFERPRGVAVDALANLYVADTKNHRVQVFNSSGTYTRTLGKTGKEGASNEEFERPRGMAVDAHGNLYVADRLNHRIQVFDSTGKYLMTIGTGQRGSNNDRFCSPDGLAFDAQGNLYVTDTGNHRIQVFAPVVGTNP